MSSVAKIGYIPQLKASNARDQDEVSSDLARMRSWYKYLIVSLVFSHLGFWSGSLFLIAPFPDLCLLVLFKTSHMYSSCICPRKRMYSRRSIYLLSCYLPEDFHNFGRNDSGPNRLTQKIGRNDPPTKAEMTHPQNWPKRLRPKRLRPKRPRAETTRIRSHL